MFTSKDSPELTAHWGVVYLAEVFVFSLPLSLSLHTHDKEKKPNIFHALFSVHPSDTDHIINAELKQVPVAAVETTTHCVQQQPCSPPSSTQACL